MEIVTIQPFLRYFDNTRARTLRVVRCVPPEKLDWTYREGKFSFGDVMRHIAATERYMWAENVQHRPSRYPGHGKELADGYENVLAFMSRMHAESMEIFGRLSDGDLQEKCTTPGGGQITIGKWLRSMVEHEVHHRGELYIYLGLLGIPAPPLYGLTSEEVRARSAPL